MLNKINNCNVTTLENIELKRNNDIETIIHYINSLKQPSLKLIHYNKDYNLRNPVVEKTYEMAIESIKSSVSKKDENVFNKNRYDDIINALNNFHKDIYEIHDLRTDRYLKDDVQEFLNNTACWTENTLTTVTKTKPDGIFLKGSYNNGDILKGKLFYPRGKIYEGEFKSEHAHGKGKLTYPNGKKYTGSFFEGKMHGYGIMEYANFAIYEGEWKKGKRNGQGKLTLPDGTVYEGAFKADKYHGLGKLTSPDGTVYEGEFKANEYHGKGKLILSECAVYEGEFKAGRYHGMGKLAHPEGAVYEGEFEENWPCQGKLTCPDGTVYQGGFKACQYDGYGELIHPDGASYKGQFKAGLPNGQGEYTYSDGRIYKGAFKAGKFDGYGVMTIDNNNTYSGLWIENYYVKDPSNIPEHFYCELTNVFMSTPVAIKTGETVHICERRSLLRAIGENEICPP